MVERITITIRPSGAHPDVLTIQDAMRQVLDVFEMLDSSPGIEWKLVNASTNSPLRIEAEAVSLEVGVDVTVLARAQKQKLAQNLRAIQGGRQPDDPDFKTKTAKRLLARNLNGVGLTEIDFENGTPVSITPKIAQVAISLIEQKPLALFEIPAAREEVGSVEGTLQDVSTYRGHPAVRIHSKASGEIWCRLSDQLRDQFEDVATFNDVWRHQRVIVNGRVKYDDEGDVVMMFASDIRRIDPGHVSLEKLKDPQFTSGLSIGEYLDRFREGRLG